MGFPALPLPPPPARGMTAPGGRTPSSLPPTQTSGRPGCSPGEGGKEGSRGGRGGEGGGGEGRAGGEKSGNHLRHQGFGVRGSAAPSTCPSISQREPRARSRWQSALQGPCAREPHSPSSVKSGPHCHCPGSPFCSPAQSCCPAPLQRFPQCPYIVTMVGSGGCSLGHPAPPHPKPHGEGAVPPLLCLSTSGKNV